MKNNEFVLHTTIQRRPDGSYWVGVQAGEFTSWVWERIRARRKDTAVKQAPEAIASLLYGLASDRATKAEDLAAAARRLISIGHCAALGEHVEGREFGPAIGTSSQPPVPLTDRSLREKLGEKRAAGKLGRK